MAEGGVDGWRSRWTVAAFVAAGLLAAVNLRMPFYGDQGLFALGASELATGHRLYTDWWDFKQPGVFLFFLLARPAGGGEVAVHLVELVWLVAWFAGAAWLLRHRWNRPWGVGAFVASSFVLYELTAEPDQLTQLEILCSPVLLVAVLLVRRAVDAASDDGGTTRPLRVSRAAFAGGVAGGVVAVAKLTYGPLVLAPVAVHLLTRRRFAWRPALAATIGLAVPVGTVLVWLARQGAWADVVETWFTLSRRLVTEIPDARATEQLRAMLEGGAVLLGPLVAGAVMGVVARRRDPLTLDLVVVAAGVLVVDALQLWWAYHFLLLYAPVAVLVADGLVAAADASRRRVLAVATATALLALPAAAHGGRKAALAVAHPTDARAFQDAVAPGYGDLIDAAATVRHLDGDVFALADPTLFALAGRQQALRLNGWAPLLDDQWAELAGDLRGDDAPRFVVVQDGFDDQFDDRGRAFAAALSERYQVVQQLPIGVLYERSS